MSENLLVERLKFAKRELTALKTAHRRGLGNLNVFSYRYPIDNDDHSGFHGATITLNFDSRFAAFPLVYLMPTIDTNTSYIGLEAIGFNFADNGRSAVFRVVYTFISEDQNYFNIISTAPILSMNLEWIDE